MKRWQLIPLLILVMLMVVFLVDKPNHNPVLSETKQLEHSPNVSDSYNAIVTAPSPVTDIKPTIPPMKKEVWFADLEDSFIMTISTMDNQMQRTYKPAERLFFNDSNALLEFFYRDIPHLSQAELEQIKKELVVKTRAEQKPIAIKVTAFDEMSSQGISIHLNQAPKADLIVQFRSLDGSLTKEFTFEYTDQFTYQIHCPEDKEADFYANHPGIFFRVAPGHTFTYQVHFTLAVNRDDAINLMQDQMKELDWSYVWTSDQELMITLHTRLQDLYKKFLINFYRVRSTEGYLLADWQVSLHGVIAEAREYEALNVATGQVRTLFHKQPRYRTLDLSPNKQFYLATELQDDSQGDYPVTPVTLLDANGNVIKHFANQALFPHWLADGQSFVYAAGDSILTYTPATDITKVVWTTPYKGIKTFYYSFDGLELDPKTGRMVVSINRLPGTAMDIGDVELYLFANTSDRSPRKAANVSKRGNSSFTFQFDGNTILYSNYFVKSDGSGWDSKSQLLDWKNLKITELKGFDWSSLFHMLQGGEFVYQKGDDVRWFRYDYKKEQSQALFIAEHPIDAAWWIGEGQYLMHDFTGTFKFNLQKPQFEKVSLLPHNAEIIGSGENTITFLQNPDPLDSI